MAKRVKKAARVSKRKKFNLVSYIEKNRVNVAIAAVIVVFIVFLGFEYVTPEAENAGGGVTTPTTIPQRYIPGRDYITSGMWTASQFNHDLGHAGFNGSWESERGGFGYLLSGPYVNIMEGSYVVSFSVKISDNSVQDSNKVVTIEVAKDMGIPVVVRDLFIGDFKASGVYQEFTLNLDTPDPLNDAEFRVHYDKSPVTVNIEKITLKEKV